MRSVVGLLLAGIALVGTATPAHALDADHRLGPPRTAPTQPVLPRPLLAELRPDVECLRVRTVPVSPSGTAGRDLLLVPCRDDLVEPPAKPWGDRPPIVIPVAPPR